jgi:RHS repeat-associated protein
MKWKSFAETFLLFGFLIGANWACSQAFSAEVDTHLGVLYKDDGQTQTIFHETYRQIISPGETATGFLMSEPFPFVLDSKTKVEVYVSTAHFDDEGSIGGVAAKWGWSCSSCPVPADIGELKVDPGNIIIDGNRLKIKFTAKDCAPCGTVVGVKATVIWKVLGCPTLCEGGGCDSIPGSINLKDQLASFSFGAGANGATAGSLAFNPGSPGPSLYTPAALQGFFRSDETEEILDSSSLPRQFLTPSALVDIQAGSNTRCEIRYYKPEDVGTKDASGVYQVLPSRTPFQVFAIENPDVTGTTSTQIRIIDVTRNSVVNETWNATNQTWEVVASNGNRRTQKTVSTDSATGDRIETETIRDQNDQILSKQEMQYHAFSWGEEMVRRTIDPDAAKLTTTWAYYDGPSSNKDAVAAGIDILDHHGADWTLSFDQVVSGRHVRVRDFVIPAGVTVVVEAGQKFWVEAENINIQGRLSGTGSAGNGANMGGAGGLRGFYTWSTSFNFFSRWKHPTSGTSGTAAGGVNGGVGGAAGMGSNIDGDPFLKDSNGYPVIHYKVGANGNVGGTGGSGGYNVFGVNSDTSTDYSLFMGGGGGAGGGGAPAETVSLAGGIIYADTGGDGGAGGAGGSGGGVIWLVANANNQITGTVEVRGTPGIIGMAGTGVTGETSPAILGGSGGTGGSGCGGGVLIEGSSVQISGNVDASGGPGGTIKIFGMNVSTSSGVLTAGRVYTGSFSSAQSGKLKQVVHEDGSWEKYEYTTSGFLSRTISSYLDAPVDAIENQCRVKTFSYLPEDSADNGSQGIGTPRKEIEFLLGREISRIYRIITLGEEKEIQAQAPGASITDLNNLVCITKTYTSGTFTDRIQSKKNHDGTMAFYLYEVDASGDKTTTISSGQPNASGDAIIDGTRVVSVVNKSGGKISETVTDILSGRKISESIGSQFDSFGRPKRVDYLDKTFTFTEIGCCGPSSLKDRDGVTTIYGYDNLGRLTTLSQGGVTTVHDYDPLNRVVKTTRVGNDNSSIVVKRLEYDVAGRVKTSTDALNQSTSYGYTTDSTGHPTKTTTLADGSTRIEKTFKDGSALSLSGTSAHEVQYEYGVELNGSIYEAFSKTILVGTSEWTKTYIDMVGRSHKWVTAANAVTESFFNNKGQLLRQKDPDGNIMIFAYNGKGEQQDVAVDMNRNNNIDYAGGDRITRTQNEVDFSHLTNVRRTTTSVFNALNLLNTYTNSVIESDLNGIQSWSTGNGLTVSFAATFDGNGGKTTITTRPDGVTETVHFQDGRVMSSETAKAGLGILKSLTWTYDSHGRQKTITDERGMVTTFIYDDLDRITKNDIVGSDGASQTTSFAYDKMGRRSSTTLPHDIGDGIVHYEYYPTGELKKTYGARTYASDYTYDIRGRLKTLAAGTGTTTWNYDATRGFLLNKRYADNKGPSYTYSTAGRLKTRTWARGSKATYTYNNAGELSLTDYSDSTPDVTFLYDRLGRLTSAVSSIETVTNTFNNANMLVTQKHTTGPLVDVSSFNGYDAFLRRNALLVTNPSVITSQTFGYDFASRLSTVSGSGRSVVYSYQPNTSLVNGITFKDDTAVRLTTAKTYDGLARLKTISSSPSADLARSFNYTYNQASQRTRVDLADGSYWVYGYDVSGQVTSGVKYTSTGLAIPGQQFGYGFDNIGNRATETQTGELGARTATYTSNNLNQYSQRAVLGVFDLLGSAAPSSTVSVQVGSDTAGIKQAKRLGDLFYKGLPLDNSVTPVNETVKVVGVKNNVGVGGEDAVTEQSGSIYLPKTPEILVYDLDGNLTSDGRWAYTWDAENRLVSMESISSVPAAIKRRLEFIYDYDGRRIQKKRYVWNSSTSLYEASITTKFVYDGWNIVAELNSNGTPLRMFYWGLDLSGSMQGAGGVGGLLRLDNIANESTYFVGSDGSGNITTLTDAVTGKLAAEHEYSPFGELTRSSGTMAKVNPFRFSSKYQDEESGLLYYGYRYYNPTTGRWFNREPLGETASNNLYSFVNNDGINYLDYLGLTSVSSTGGASVTAASSPATPSTPKPQPNWDQQTRANIFPYDQPTWTYTWHSLILCFPKDVDFGRVSRKIYNDFSTFLSFDSPTRNLGPVEVQDGIARFYLWSSVDSLMNQNLGGNEEGVPVIIVPDPGKNPNMMEQRAMTAGDHQLVGVRKWRVEKIDNHRIMISTDAWDTTRNWANRHAGWNPMLAGRGAQLQIWTTYLLNIASHYLPPNADNARLDPTHGRSGLVPGPVFVKHGTQDLWENPFLNDLPKNLRY